MATDLKFIILWWVFISLFSLSVLPFIASLFKNFYDKGYIFAKIASLVLISYLVYVLGVFKLATFSKETILIVWLIISYLIWKKYKGFLKILKKYYKIFLLEELVFVLILITWSFVRGFNPDIEGLEKFMDWGFINSMLRTKYMPPVDMWFSGKPINYYYFGHFVFAVLTKISGISSAITYNLSIATICALTFVSSFSLTSNLTYLYLQKIKKINYQFIIISGLISALLLSFGGNLHTVYKVSADYIENHNLKKAITNYWYPDATRFIGFDPDTKDKTIHEFPLYSFVVSDLHGHLNDVPIVLFYCAFLFISFSIVQAGLINWTLVVGSGFILALCYMTNAWDFAIYGLLYGIFSLISFKKILNTMINGIAIIIFWYLFSLPFTINFIPMLQGIRISDGHTPFYQLFVLYGGFWLIVIPYVIAVISKLFSKKNSKLTNSDYFILALVLTATLLIIIPELIYFKDIYIYEHRRANTMFKLVYQAFIMYSLTSGFIIIRLLNTYKKRFHFFLYKLIFLLIFISQLFYSYFAIKSFYSFENYKGLPGDLFLKKSYPSNYFAIKWINEHISGQPVMLEASGDSYTLYNQVSIATGLPTVQGWLVHEWLWRGNYEEPAARVDDVQSIYESNDFEEISSLINKYNIEYIFVGPKEKEKYKNFDTGKFLEMGYSKIYESGKSSIYKVVNTDTSQPTTN